MLTLKKKEIIPAVITSSWKRLRFPNNARFLSWSIRYENHKICRQQMMLLHSDWTKEDYNNEIFRLYDNEGKELFAGNIHKAFPKVRRFSPCCSYCEGSDGKFKLATKIMSDGYLTCDDCHHRIEPYYHCAICDKSLKPHLARMNRNSIQQRFLCGDYLCRKQCDVKTGKLCCEKAEYVGCVCAYAYKCPVHAPNEVHVGTHD